MVVQLHKRGLLGCPICICTKCTHHLPFSTCIKFGGDWRHKRPINSLTFPESGDFLLCTISTRICHYSIGGGFVHQGFFCGFMLFSLPTSDLSDDTPRHDAGDYLGFQWSHIRSKGALWSGGLFDIISIGSASGWHLAMLLIISLDLMKLLPNSSTWTRPWSRYCETEKEFNSHLMNVMMIDHPKRPQDLPWIKWCRS